MAKVGQRYSQVMAVLAGAGFRSPQDGVWQCAEYVRQVLLRCTMPTRTVARLANAGETPAALAEWVDGCGVELDEVVNDQR